MLTYIVLGNGTHRGAAWPAPACHETDTEAAWVTAMVTQAAWVTPAICSMAQHGLAPRQHRTQG